MILCYAKYICIQLRVAGCVICIVRYKMLKLVLTKLLDYAFSAQKFVKYMPLCFWFSRVVYFSPNVVFLALLFVCVCVQAHVPGKE